MFRLIAYCFLRTLLLVGFWISLTDPAMAWQQSWSQLHSPASWCPKSAVPLFAAACPNSSADRTASHPPVPTVSSTSTATTTTSRRNLLGWGGSAGLGLALAVFPLQQPAHALVKGNAPPPSSKPKSDKPKCTNVEECQAAAEKREQEEREAAAASATPASVTSTGIRYRDVQEPAAKNTGTAAAAAGDEVTIYYKVLKLGKRSYDGLSGEGTVVFSRGYGLEDDEKVPGDKSFTTTLGSPFNIVALNEAVVGMPVGGIRRFAVLPQKGWRKPGTACDGGPGGSGAGGDLKTDYVVVPTATMVAEEACFDSTKQPFPASYAQQRRMAQRFDQSLIMEVELVSTRPSDL